MASITQFVTQFAVARARKREQWLSPAELKELRGSRLRRLARAAVKTAYYSPIFLDAGLSPEQLIDERELVRLPVLERNTLYAAKRNGLLAEPEERLLPFMSSGFTGQPVPVLRSKRDRTQVSALWARIMDAYGHRFFDSQVNIGGDRTVAGMGLVALLRRLGVIPRFRQVSSFEPVEQQVAILRKHRPHTISAYAVSLEMIADTLLDRGIRSVRPKVLFGSAMPFTDRGKAAAAQAFGVAPLEVYAAAEVGTLAWECPDKRGVFHLNDDMQIVEILDDRDRPVPDGETGQVVVTQLCCLAEPLIRYRLGDLAARVPTGCGCGRGLARLSPVQGQTRHTIRTPDGRLLYEALLSRVVGPFHEVRRWQLRQTASDRLSLLVVPSPTWRPEVVGELAQHLVDRLGPAVRFEVVPVEDIPLAPAGKFQTIVPLARVA